MSGEEGFLARWSRRKRTEPEARPLPAPAPEAPPAEAEPALPPEELALLPSIEELTAESDITGFLRQGVPRSLRNAALRQAWLLDPAVRDRVGDALDYAWDYNIPGGAPGYGPIDPGTDVAGMVRAMFSRREGDPAPEEGAAPAEVEVAAAPEEVTRADHSPEPEEVLHEAPAEEVAAREMSAQRAPAAEAPALAAPVRPAPLDRASPLRPGPEPALAAPAPARRRHGGAMPL